MKRLTKKGAQYSRRLTQFEIEQYDAIGQVDFEQDHLEIFTDRIIRDLIKIKDSKVSDNQAKADAIQKYLQPFGFVEIDLGTNIYVMAHYDYPGVVFKFALDDNGVADNFNDEWLQDYIPELAPVIALHPSGMISVQERKVIFRERSRINMFLGDILDLLRRLSKMFVLVDVSPLSIRNYYIDRDGTIGFADASDLYLIPENYNIFKCRNTVDVKSNGKPIYCGGTLKYDDIYSSMICKKCGKVYNPWSLRRSKKEEIKMLLVSPGMTKEEWESINSQGRTIRRLSRTLGPDVDIDVGLRQIMDQIHKTQDDPNEDDEKGSIVIRGDEVLQSSSSGPFDIDDSVSVTTEGDLDSEVSEDSVEIQTVSEHIARAIFEKMEGCDCQVEVKNSDGNPGIYLTLNSPDLEETLKESGPDIFLSNNGGREYTKVITSAALASAVRTQVEELAADGLWSMEDD